MTSSCTKSSVWSAICLPPDPRRLCRRCKTSSRASRLRCTLNLLPACDAITDTIVSRTVEKDRNFLSSEKERRFNALRDDEAELLKLQVKESQLKHQMHEKETLEQHIEEMREEQARSTTLVKVSLKPPPFTCASDLFSIPPGS